MKRRPVQSALVLAMILFSISSTGHAQPLCFGQRATLVGSGTIIGTNGNDVIVGSAERDLILGHGGNDLICAGAGDDVIDGGDGNDRIDGGAGDDVIIDRAGDDVLLGDAGNDVIHSRDGDDQVDGGPGHDICVSSSGQGSVSNCEQPGIDPRLRRPSPPERSSPREMRRTFSSDMEPSFQPIASRTFRICPGEDHSSLEREIEQFIAGRNVSATLQNRADGCFDLTVEVLPGAPSGGGISTIVSVGSGRTVVNVDSGSTGVSVGSSTTSVTVGSSSSAGHTVSVRIVSTGGATDVTITTTR